jgi:hypothetical protein
MTGEAAKSFMHADRGAVITGADFHAYYRRVALVAQRLANIGTDLYQTLAVVHDWQRKLVEGHVVKFPAIKQRQ